MFRPQFLAIFRKHIKFSDVLPEDDQNWGWNMVMEKVKFIL
jgi:hypothetical protein